MPLLSTEKWKRIGTIATAIAALGGIVWSTVVFANDFIKETAKEEIKNSVPELIDIKIEEHSVETVEKISEGINSMQLQMYSMQERLVKSDIRSLTQGKSVQELTAEEKSQYEYLLNEQKIIQEEKRKLRRTEPNN